MRFASHRDVARAIERGVRKAGIPVAHSAGFSPHPRISYSGGAPTGSASEAEYLELAVTRRCEPDDAGRRLDAALPDGIDVVEVVEVDGKSAGLALEASAWEVALPGVTADAAERAVRAFLAQPRFEVQRLTSKGAKTVDVRAGIVSLTCTPHTGTDPAAGCAILRMIVRQMTPVVRPDDLLAALRQISALEPGTPAIATRLWQGPMRDCPSDQIVQETTAVRRGRCSSPDEFLSGRKTDKATQLEAESAITAPASQVRANEQLPRGARGHVADSRAREPYGRDCPDARNGATEQQRVTVQ